MIKKTFNSTKAFYFKARFEKSVYGRRAFDCLTSFAYCYNSEQIQNKHSNCVNRTRMNGNRANGGTINAKMYSLKVKAQQKLRMMKTNSKDENENTNRDEENAGEIKN